MDEAEELAWRRAKDEPTRNHVRASFALRHGIDALAILDDPQFVATLSDRERVIVAIRLRHGFSLEDSARVLRVTRERIRQIEHKVVRKYRERTNQGG